MTTPGLPSTMPAILTGSFPDPLTYIAYLASLTERIRLCSGVMVVPLHNTVRLVENVSFVDILTKGRFVFGIGSGYREYEFEALGADFESRRQTQAEALDVMMRLFNDHQIDHKGVQSAGPENYRRTTRCCPVPFSSHIRPCTWGRPRKNRLHYARVTGLD